MVFGVNKVYAGERVVLFIKLTVYGVDGNF